MWRRLLKRTQGTKEDSPKANTPGQGKANADLMKDVLQAEDTEKRDLKDRLGNYKANRDDRGAVRKMTRRQTRKPTIFGVSKEIATRMQALARNLSSRTRKMNRLKSLNKAVISQWYLVDPNGEFKKIWETLKFILLMYQFFYLPIRICLFDTEINTGLYAADKSIDGFLFLDVILNFFTPVYFNYEIATNFKIIAKSYLKTWFFFDIFSLFPFEEIVNAIADDSNNLTLFAQLLRFLRFLRLLRLIKVLIELDYKNTDNYAIILMERTLKNTPFFLLLPNFIIIFLLMHIFSCIWYNIGTANDNNSSWIVLTNFQDNSLFDKYIVSFYFVVQTLTTTGYGDIDSKTNNEIGFRIFMMFVAVLIYGLFSGQIVNYRSNKMAQEETLAVKTQKLEELKKHYSINPVLYRFILQRLSENKAITSKQERDLSALSKEELEILEYSLLINRFAGHCLFNSDERFFDFQVKLGRLMKRKYYHADQIIYGQGEASVLFYIVVSGSVTVMKDDIDSVPVLLIENSYFGEFEIFKNMNRLHTVKAYTDCDVYYVDSMEFKKLVLEEPVFYEQFCEKSRLREYEIEKSSAEIDHFIIRKCFWRQALRGKVSRKQKKDFKKLVHEDKFRGKRSANLNQALRRAAKRGNTIADFDDD